ncbi:MAG: hypothetical protein ACRC2T_08295, partial [Thermoguttaceae bacterium]
MIRTVTQRRRDCRAITYALRGPAGYFVFLLVIWFMNFLGVPVAELLRINPPLSVLVTLCFPVFLISLIVGTLLPVSEKESVTQLDSFYDLQDRAQTSWELLKSGKALSEMEKLQLDDTAEVLSKIKLDTIKRQIEQQRFCSGKELICYTSVFLFFYCLCLFTPEEKFLRNTTPKQTAPSTLPRANGSVEPTLAPSNNDSSETVKKLLEKLDDEIVKSLEKLAGENPDCLPLQMLASEMTSKMMSAFAKLEQQKNSSQTISTEMLASIQDLSLLLAEAIEQLEITLSGMNENNGLSTSDSSESDTVAEILEQLKTKLALLETYQNEFDAKVAFGSNQSGEDNGNSTGTPNKNWGTST